MRLIFHGDDFGLTSGINRGIIRSFKEGLLSSASLVVNGEAAEEAVSLAKENPGLDLGVHLVLCDESPVLPPDQVPSIISGGSAFPPRREIVKAILIQRIDYREAEAEWSAQVKKALNAGLLISHLDGHQFVHLFPGLFPVCLRVADKFQIPYVRASILDLMTLEVGLKRLSQWVLLKWWVRVYVSRLLPSHIRTIDSLGFLHSGGRMSIGAVLRAVDALGKRRPSSVVEVNLHPGIGDEYTQKKYMHWQYNWKNDLDLLLDGSLKEAMDLRGVELTSFRKEL